MYSAGQIKDYDLFPGGRLDKGVAIPTNRAAQQAATRDAALGWFHEHEKAAGVTPMKGRGWYGLRRLYTDQGPKHTSNEKTLNTLSGTSTAMRTGVYQDKESLESKLDAARVAAAIRSSGRVGGATPTPNPLLLQPRLARALSIYTPEEIELAIHYLESLRATNISAPATVAITDTPFEKTDFVDPLVDPNAKTRVHVGTRASRSDDESTTS